MTSVERQGRKRSPRGDSQPVNTLRRWKSTVRGLTNSWAATSRFDNLTDQLSDLSLLRGQGGQRDVVALALSPRTRAARRPPSQPTPAREGR